MSRTDRTVAELLERFTRALGPTAGTPEWVMAPDYRETRRLVRARYRVWRWRCPVCGGGENDPQRIWRPLVLDSDGRVLCQAAGCSPERIAAEVAVRLDAVALLDALGIP